MSERVRSASSREPRERAFTSITHFWLATALKRKTSTSFSAPMRPLTTRGQVRLWACSGVLLGSASADSSRSPTSKLAGLENPWGVRARTS